MNLARTWIALNLLFLCLCVQTEAKQKKITVTGRLVHAVAIGAESTGWTIQLEREMKIDGDQVDSIEVESTSQKLDQFVDKIVKAQGKLATVHGVERGDRTVLDIYSIKEVHTKAKT
ncbi:MAG TPA: hypothetical protein VGM27_26730 [Acidobacteriaceae bacterium]